MFYSGANYSSAGHVLTSPIGTSTVHSPTGLMFESPFDFSRFASQDTPTARDRELDINFRKKQLL